MNKILVVGTGGTIACVKGENIHLDNPFKILDYIETKNTDFECVSPFSVLSENISIDLWKKLIDYLNTVDFEKYKGVIILHGSDTLAYTSALIGNMFEGKNIVLVASDKPIEDKTANGIENFKNAVLQLENGNGVCVSYDGIHNPLAMTSADCRDKFVDIAKFRPPYRGTELCDKNILVISCYPAINYNNYNIDEVDAVLHTMYHSATAPRQVAEFIEKCKAQGVPFYFVTAKDSVEYESAKDFEKIIFNSTVEDAYAKLLLKAD